MSRDSDKTRAKIIQAADDLFYAGGLRGVSVDEIASHAGVTKKTFYYHFRSKDDVITVYLEARSAPTLDRFKDWAGSSGTVAERMARLFDKLGSLAHSSAWLGCGFMRVTAELANLPGHPAIQVGRAHKLAVEDWLRNDLVAEGWDDADAVARGLMVLIDGTVAQMLMHRDPRYAIAASAAARSLLSRTPPCSVQIRAQDPISPPSSLLQRSSPILDHR